MKSDSVPRPVSSWLRRLWSLSVDALTILILVVCIWVAAQPGSAVRRAWDSHRSTVLTRKAADRHWSRVVALASRLYDGDEHPLLIEVSDYECPFCRRAVAVVDSALAAGARIGYVHIPRLSSVSGISAATAAVCADMLGQFKDMHGYLMRTSDWQTNPDWGRHAQLAGIRHVDDFEECIESNAARAMVDSHRALAESLAVTGTPTFVSLRKVYRGVVDTETLLNLGTTRP